ncbi:hypothetical protein ABVT39_003431, partial [Epinephelus coioides]
SYTYVSKAWNTTSWLDHCVSTADAHECVDKVEILYGFATTDHMPVSIMLNVENLPTMTTDDNQVNHGGKIEWAKLSENDLLHYHDLTEKTIGNTEIPYDAIMCDNFNCGMPNHKEELCVLYDRIVQGLNEASKPLIQRKAK